MGISDSGGARNDASDALALEMCPEVTEIAEAWATLPEATRAAVLAIVRAAKAVDG
ncbi:MAG: hypothetical protein U1E05_10445 [Patescibacteria group bacterium]|nr:hypothetical protein [Patescibacteria group bacterium]